MTPLTVSDVVSFHRRLSVYACMCVCVSARVFCVYVCVCVSVRTRIFGCIYVYRRVCVCRQRAGACVYVRARQPPNIITLATTSIHTKRAHTTRRRVPPTVVVVGPLPAKRTRTVRDLRARTTSDCPLHRIADETRDSNSAADAAAAAAALALQYSYLHDGGGDW